MIAILVFDKHLIQPTRSINSITQMYAKLILITSLNFSLIVEIPYSPNGGVIFGKPFWGLMSDCLRKICCGMQCFGSCFSGLLTIF